MKNLKRIGILSIPCVFAFAGIGMLLLLNVRNADGTFFERINSNTNDWLIAHVLLLVSTVFILPAALTLRSAISSPRTAAIGTLMVTIAAPASILLAGQYAIDFVMPLLAQVGGDALKVHPLLFSTPTVNLLFYSLPDLVFLSLMILSIALMWSGPLPRLPAGILLANWSAILFGNLVSPLFQRIAILVLAASFLPLVTKLWSSLEKSSIDNLHE